MSVSKYSDTPVDLNFRPRPRSWTFSSGEPISPQASVADAQCDFTPPTVNTFVNAPLFSIQINNSCNIPAHHFIHTTDHEQMFIFVDGSLLYNKLVNVRAGYGVVFTPIQWFHPIPSCLEQGGFPQTKNRAELPAVLAVAHVDWQSIQDRHSW